MNNKIIIIFFTTIIAMILLTTTVFAANHYVRPNAYSSGNNTGTDWTNAFRGMPAYNHAFWTSMLQPGDTVYVAGGTYTTAWNINKGGTSENARIIIKRATVAAHGTDIGWESGLDRTVMLSGVNIQFYANSSNDYKGHDYITVDGVTGNGIKIDLTGVGGHGILLSYNNRGTTNYITLRNIEIAGYGQDCEVANSDGIHDTPVANPISNSHQGLKVQGCNIYNVCGAAIALRYSNDVLIEQNIIHDIGGKDTTIHEDHVIIYSSNNGTIRNNEMYDVASLGILFEVGNNSGWSIYNNLFYQKRFAGSGDAIKFTGKVGGSVSNIKIYNNTIYGFRYGVIAALPTDGTFHYATVYNNIIYDSLISYTSSIDHDYNYYSSEVPSGDGGHSIANGANPFVDSANKDYQLKAGALPIDRGKTLDAVYSKAFNKVTRPQGGAWDIGAYEYLSAQSTLFVTSANGTVTSNPSGINCGSTCYANFDADAWVTLAATPKSGYIFSGWSGGGCSGTGTCTVNMAAAQVVTANYAVAIVAAPTLPTAIYYLTVNKTISTAGIITASDNTINCGSTCKYYYNSGKSVTLTVTTNSGYKFTRWTGACKGQGATCTVSMTASQNTKAYFAETK